MNDRQWALPFDVEPAQELPAPEAPPSQAMAPTPDLAFLAAPSLAPALPPTLDETMIGVVVLREADQALELYPDWAHPFAGLSFNRARRCYGQAHRDGRIVISKVFIGTDALDDLEDTVRHELAHLIVGIDQRHGTAWRRVAKRLGAEPRARGRAVSPDLASRMDDAPFTLVAVLESGEERELKPAYRRSRRFTEYRHSPRGRSYAVAGQTVKRFYYAERRSD